MRRLNIFDNPYPLSANFLKIIDDKGIPDAPITNNKNHQIKVYCESVIYEHRNYYKTSQLKQDRVCKALREFIASQF